MKECLLAVLFCLAGSSLEAQVARISRGLIAFWNFDEPAGQPRKSSGGDGNRSYVLMEGNGPVQRVDEGPINGCSALLQDQTWFYIPRDSMGRLNISGRRAFVTVIAWVKKSSEKKWQAIAGVWDETRNKRQYFLFANASLKTHQDEMVRYPAEGLVHGHISATGGKTPGHLAWISYASSNDPIPVNQWVMVALTYDGKNIKVYIDGVLSENVKTNPFPYTKGIFDGGKDGAYFTVGANSVGGRMTNQFIGYISGLAVFDRALNASELKKIFKDPASLTLRR